MFASSVEAYSDLALMSDGYWTMEIRAHESGAVGHDYLVYVIPEARDPQGRMFTFAKEGYVAGTFAFGSRDEQFRISGYDSQIHNSWQALKDSGATNHLHVSTSALAVTQSVLVGLGVAASVAGLALFGGSDGVHCDPVVQNGGVDYACRKQW
jgi:hypothetical protein